MFPWRQAIWSQCVQLKAMHPPSLHLKDTPLRSHRTDTTARQTLPPHHVPGPFWVLPVGVFFLSSVHGNALIVQWCHMLEGITCFYTNVSNLICYSLHIFLHLCFYACSFLCPFKCSLLNTVWRRSEGCDHVLWAFCEYSICALLAC